MAADRYDNGFTRYAYGNADGVLFDEPIVDHTSTGYSSEADRGIAISGEAPWVMLYDNVHTTATLPEHPPTWPSSSVTIRPTSATP